MKQWAVTILILSLGVLGAASVAQADRDRVDPDDVVEPAQSGPTFFTIDLTIDPKGNPLGAFQIEMTSPDTTFSVVGVEAGEHAAFDHGRPPYFDPVAQQDGTDRLIVAEYAKPELNADDLPTDAVHVVTVHAMVVVTDEEAPEPLIQLKLLAAGNADGERIDADVSYSFRTPAAAPERPE